MDCGAFYRALLSRCPPRDPALLQDLIRAAVRGGALSHHQADWTRAILELGLLQMRNVMVPRVDVVAVAEDCRIDQAARLMSECGRRRLPVYRGDIDHPVGVLHAVDVAQWFASRRVAVELPTASDLARQPVTLSDSLPLLEGFEKMRREGAHLVLITEKHGGFGGLATLEDIFEQIVGPFPDEYGDDGRHSVRLVAPGEAVVGAAARLHELELLFDVDLPDDEFASVGGLVYEILGRVPRPGDVVELPSLRLEVLSVDGVRIRELRVRTRTGPADSPETEAASGPREVDSPSRTPRAALSIGSDVWCADRIVGRLEKLVVDPSSGRVIHLVIKGDNGSYLVPADAVEREQDDFIFLRPSACNLDLLEPYDPVRYLAAARDALGNGRASGEVVYPLGATAKEIRSRKSASHGKITVPGDDRGVDVTLHTKVHAADGPVGHVDHVLLDPESGEVTHIVVRRRAIPLLPSHDLIVPMSWARSVTPERIVLGVRRADLARLPAYRPDEVIEGDVIRRLNEDPRFQGVDFYTLHVDVKAGVVFLYGNVRDRELKRVAEEYARATPGVLDVKNNLVADDELAEEVQRRIVTDGRFNDDELEVESAQGVVKLIGHVSSPEERDALTDLVEQTPGVQGVTNLVEVGQPVGPNCPSQRQV